MALLQARFSKFGLRLAEEKCHQTDLSHRRRHGNQRRAIEFLGFKICRTRTRNGQGFKTEYRIESRRYSRAKQKVKGQIRRGMHGDLKSQAKGINKVLMGLYNYYGVSGNSGHLCNLHHYAEWTWRHYLSHRSNKAHVAWEPMKQILAKYPLARPRIRYGYQKLRELVVL